MRAVRLGGLCALLCAGLALGANPKVTSLVKEGDRLYKDNKYAEAAETLKKAYALEPSPVLLYNIARAYDQAGELQPALDYYRQYTSQEGSDPALVKKANLAMDRLRTLVAKDEADKKLREAEKKRLEDEASQAKQKAESEAERAKAQREAYEAKEAKEREAAQKKTDTRLIATFATGGFAVAALGCGIGFGLAANGSKSSFLGAGSVADKQSLESQTKTQALVADLSFALAVAAGIATIVLVPKGSDEPPKSVQLGFAPLSGGGVVSFGGRF